MAAVISIGWDRGHSGDVERQERCSSHGVDIREGVGSGDGAVVVRIIHHRGEKIGGHYQGALLIQLPDGSIIRIAQTDQQVWEVTGIKQALNRAQDLRQRLRVELGSSTGAVGEAGQADVLAVLQRRWLVQMFTCIMGWLSALAAGVGVGKRSRSAQPAPVVRP